MIHEQGLVSVLKQIHDDLDAAVAAAYGWPTDLTDEQILQKLVALNAERAEEERRGIIRWLRPEFQNPGGATTQQTLGISGIKAEKKENTKRATKMPWPRAIVGQALALRAAQAGANEPVKAAAIADLLVALEALGQAGKVDGEQGRLRRRVWVVASATPFFAEHAAVAEATATAFAVDRC